MPEIQQQEKAELRKQVREKLCLLSAAEREQASAQAVSLMKQQRAWISAKSILFYAPHREELDIWPLLLATLHKNRKAFLPRFESKVGSYCICEVRNPERDIQVGRYGIREPSEFCPPIALNPLDLVLVPGVAFDLHGRRLGRGKGYYDRLLDTVRGKTCGVAFDEQIVSRVPVEPHDVQLNCILTPTRWIEL